MTPLATTVLLQMTLYDETTPEGARQDTVIAPLEYDALAFVGALGAL